MSCHNLVDFSHWMAHPIVKSPMTYGIYPGDLDFVAKVKAMVKVKY